MKFKKAVFIKIVDSHFDQKYWDKIDELVEEKVLLAPDDPKIKNELKNCDCLLLGFQVTIGKDILDAAPNLKYIGVLATAYGTIDLAAAAKRGIPVCNLGGYSTESVAEFTIAAILHEIRDIKEGLKRAQAGNYGFEGIKGIRARELKNSNFGVIGLGNFGNRVAELAAGFGANVSYWSRTKKKTPFQYQELETLLSACTYISVNVAETEETTGLLNAKNLPLIKPDSVLISTVPPTIIDTDALAARLSKNDITFIFDHPDEMQKEELAKIFKLDNCITYPPIAFVSDEAEIAKQEIFIGNMVKFLEGSIQNKVN
ncbi:MAG: NAD(P)-dependent oxidoreductase [Candidatus Paceibacterota bacterium]